MSALPFGPYDSARDAPQPGTVPVTALVLTKSEEPNIARCLSSLAWCDQILVIDSGSSDDTVHLAVAAGAEVVEQPWLGFAGQREFALRHPTVLNDWVYFVDADEWVSAALALEVAAAVAKEDLVAYAHRLRLIFLGRWIRHCGWYGGSWVIRLGRREALRYDVSTPLGERAIVEGDVGRLRYDIVDEDLKGLAAWLQKHVRYAEVEAVRRSAVEARLRVRWARWHRGERAGRSTGRSFAKDVALPALPAPWLWMFVYMYVIRAGWRDGRQGMVFCLLHAWFQLVVEQLGRERRSQSSLDPSEKVTRGRAGVP